MLPLAHISHLTRRRVRIKIPSKKGDRNYLTALKERFSGFEGIETIEINPVTGSVLIIHNSDMRTIAEYAMVNNLFILKGIDSFPAGLQQRVSGAFKSINGQLKTATGGEIDIGGLAFLVLLSVGVYQISMGNLTALPWYAAFWYAFNIFLKSGQGAGVEP
jgi:hypothetical protein